MESLDKLVFRKSFKIIIEHNNVFVCSFIYKSCFISVTYDYAFDNITTPNSLVVDPYFMLPEEISSEVRLLVEENLRERTKNEL